MKNLTIVTLSLATLSYGCFPTGTGKGKLKHASSATQLNITVSPDGEEASAAFNANSKETQVLAAPAGSPIAGVTTSFPPGALGVSAEISIGPGADIVDQDELISKLGLQAEVSFAELGSSVSIQASVDMDTKVPFTLALPIPDSALHLTQGQNYAVVYKSENITDNSVALGIIPTTQITVKDGIASFSSTHFGTYQLVLSTQPIAEKVEAKISAFVASTPVSIEKVTPFVADAGETVTVFGKDFTGQMVMTIANRQIKKVDVKSDSAVSFIVPSDVPFGFTDLQIAQADQTKEYGLIARSNDKLDYPLITMEASGVCEGVKYYDAQGDLHTGTKECAAASATTGVGGTDADGNGIIDEADKANFALGKEGSQITAASNITLPADGNHFVVVGSTPITSIASKPAGTRVSFTADSEATFYHLGSTTNYIRLKKQSPIKIGSKDLLELMATADGKWIEINSVIHTIEGFEAIYNGNLTVTNSTFTTLPFSMISQDPDNAYNSQSQQYVVPESGNYTFNGSLYAIWNGMTEMKTYVNIQIFKNGSQWISTAYCDTPGDNRECTAAPTSNPSSYWLQQGDYLEFKLISYNYATGQAPAEVQSATVVVNKQ